MIWNSKSCYCKFLLGCDHPSLDGIPWRTIHPTKLTHYKWRNVWLRTSKNNVETPPRTWTVSKTAFRSPRRPAVWSFQNPEINSPRQSAVRISLALHTPTEKKVSHSRMTSCRYLGGRGEGKTLHCRNKFPFYQHCHLRALRLYHIGFINGTFFGGWGELYRKHFSF
jgi:hypothetical protein